MKFSIAVVALLAGLAAAAPQQRGKGKGKASGKASGANSQASGGNGQASGGNNQGQNSNNGGNTQASNSTQAQGANTTGTNAQPKVNAETAALMETAVNAWMRDTGVVSNFLNTATTLNDDTTFKNQANIAHSAEVDELTHKQVLDQFMPNVPSVKAANATLSNGAFQLVVDVLQQMTDQGMANAQGQVDKINNDRCIDVLPNIDAYMAAASDMIGNGNPVKQSVRPAACEAIVQGTPAGGNNNGQNNNGQNNNGQN